MNVLDELLKNRFIIKSNDREKYYKIKDELPTVREFLQDKLGYRIIVNPMLIKLEKLPGRAEPYMGILEFTTVVEYAMLCIVLMFLEEKSPEEQFILSQLTEYIQVNYPGDRIDWTSYSIRKSFIKVMKYCSENSFFKTTEGDDEAFIKDSEIEVLYETIGVSRYFMRHFIRDIMSFSSVSDFERSEWMDMNEERGIVRRNRVYRQLLLAPMVKRETDDDEDFVYIRNFRNTIAKEMEELLDSELQIHKACAMLVVSNDANFSRVFPENNNLSDITLSVFSLIRRDVGNNEKELLPNESIRLHKDEFTLYIRECKECFGKYYGKTYREKSDRELTENVLSYMAGFGFVVLEGSYVIVSPMAGKFKGIYNESDINSEV